MLPILISYVGVKTEYVLDHDLKDLVLMLNRTGSFECPQHMFWLRNKKKMFHYARPPDKSAYWKIIWFITFYFSSKTYVMGTHMFKFMSKNII